MGKVRIRQAGVCLAALGGLLVAQAAPPAGKAVQQQNQAVPATEDAAEAAPQTERPPIPREKYVPPPRPLHKVGDHWTPYDPPEVPEGVEPYVIVAGDTLWGLAQKEYGDPYLWPNIWDANRWITYSHWIYPGDPLVIPGRPAVVTEDGPEALPEPEPEPEPTPEPEPVVEAPAGPALFPAFEASELLCAPQLLQVFDPAPLRIAGRETAQKTLLGTGDIVYLSAGRDMAIKAGAEYVVVRPDQVLVSPTTKKPHAVYVRRLGRVRTIAVQPNSATAEVSFACSAIEDGDFLVPYHELQVPMIEHLDLASIDPNEAGRMQGVVLVTKEPAARLGGTGDLVGIDLDSRSGLKAGDRVLFWRSERTTPRRLIAQGVVVGTNGGGSTVKVLEAVEEIMAGDAVDVR